MASMNNLADVIEAFVAAFKTVINALKTLLGLVEEKAGDADATDAQA